MNKLFDLAREYTLDALGMSLLYLWVEKDFRSEIFEFNRGLFESIMNGDAQRARRAATDYVDYVAKKYREVKEVTDRAAALS